MSKKKLGDRHNKGKLRWDTFPPFLIRPVIKVADYGSNKYEDFNFLKGLDANTTYSCLMRHLDKFMDPKKSDYDDFDDDGSPGSGQHHLAHVAWNALVMLYHIENNPELDNRFKLDNEEES